MLTLAVMVTPVVIAEQVSAAPRHTASAMLMNQADLGKTWGDYTRDCFYAETHALVASWGAQSAASMCAQTHNNVVGVEEILGVWSGAGPARQQWAMQSSADAIASPPLRLHHTFGAGIAVSSYYSPTGEQSRLLPMASDVSVFHKGTTFGYMSVMYSGKKVQQSANELLLKLDIAALAKIPS
jgi:hypothetical protein